jgi:aspartate carbamoyltransferase catalytic subunit
MCNFDTTFHFISPDELKLPSYVKQHIKDKKLDYYQYRSIEEAIGKADILYMTRVQRERFADPIEYERVKNSYILTKRHLKNCKENMKVLHPLPRVNEIAEDVDKTPQAYYFQQAQNGVYVRQALLSTILGVTQ